MRERMIKNITGLVVFLFVVILLFLARFGGLTKFINKVISPVFAFFVIGKTIFLEKKDHIPKEILIYTVFLFWTLTGLTFATSYGAFWNYLR